MRHLLIMPLFISALLMSYFSNAQLPLITDNAGVIGKGKGQIELSNGLGFNNEHRCVEKSTEIAPVFTYGIINKMDMVVGVPFLFSEIFQDSVTSKVAGFSDINIELKYCFYNLNNLSLALKPGISFPTGKYKEGLGSGVVSASAFFISSVDISSFKINGNIGYMLNANKCGDALHIWHFSADADLALDKQFHIVANSGIEKNPDMYTKSLPAFGLIGFYYCFSDNCEICMGYKKGLTLAETDHAFIYGLTLRF